MNRHRGRGRLRARACAALLSLGSILLSLTMPAAAASTGSGVSPIRPRDGLSAPPPTYNLSSATAPVTTSTGQRVLVGVEANNNPYEEATATGVETAVFFDRLTGEKGSTARDGFELYDFMNLLSGDLQVSGLANAVTKATLTVGAADWGTQFGSLSLTFTPSGYTDASCSNAAEGYYRRTYRGSLSGSFSFYTGQKGTQKSQLGWIWDRHLSFTSNELGRSTSSLLTVDNGCEQDGVPNSGRSYCSRGLLAASPLQHLSEGGLPATESIMARASTSNGHVLTSLYAERDVVLAGLGPGQDNVGVSGIREDVASEAASEFPVWRSTVWSPLRPIAIHIGPSRISDPLFSGSATLSIPRSGRLASKCARPGKDLGSAQEITYSNYLINEADTTVVPTTWTNGLRRLTAHVPIGGDITVYSRTSGGKNAANGGFLEYTTYR